MTSLHLSRPIGLSAAFFVALSGAGLAAPAPAPYRPPGIAGRPTTIYLDDTVVVARVNDKVIRAGDYVDRWFNSDLEYRPVPDSLGRVDFLKRLVDKEVIASVAREAKAPETMEDRAEIRDHIQRTLGNALFEHAVLESVTVHQAEAESVYNQMKRELHLGRIRFGTHETAVRMRRDLLASRISWARAWQLRLWIPGDASVSPDVGWHKWQDMPPKVAREIFALPLEGLSQPIAEPPGFSLYRVLEERPLKLQPFRMYRAIITDQLRDEKTALYRERLISGLRKSAGLRLDSLNAAWVAARFPKTITGEGTSRVVLDATVPEFTPEDTGRVVATYQTGNVTVGRLLNTYRSIPEVTRPSLDTPEGVKGEVDVIVLEPMLAELARKRGYDRDSATVVLIERKREEIMVEHVFRDSIQAHVFVPPAVRRKYYHDNQHRFVTPPNARYAAFYVKSKGEADSLIESLRRGVRATAIIRADSMAGNPRGQIFDRRQGDENVRFPQVFAPEMKEGDVTYLGDKDGGYNVLQLIQRDWGRPVPFEQADAQIDEYLQQEAADKKLDEFVARHSRQMTIVTHPELLMRIRLMAPPQPGENPAQR